MQVNPKELTPITMQLKNLVSQTKLKKGVPLHIRRDGLHCFLTIKEETFQVTARVEDTFSKQDALTVDLLAFYRALSKHKKESGIELDLAPLLLEQEDIELDSMLGFRLASEFSPESFSKLVNHSRFFSRTTFSDSSKQMHLQATKTTVIAHGTNFQSIGVTLLRNDNRFPYTVSVPANLGTKINELLKKNREKYVKLLLKEGEFGITIGPFFLQGFSMSSSVLDIKGLIRTFTKRQAGMSWRSAGLDLPFSEITQNADEEVLKINGHLMDRSFAKLAIVLPNLFYAKEEDGFYYKEETDNDQIRCFGFLSEISEVQPFEKKTREESEDEETFEEY